MKHIHYLYTLVLAFALASCGEDLPEAFLGLFQADELSATAGDELVNLTWTPQHDKTAPQEYLLLWTAGNTEGQDGSRVVSASETSATIDGLVNNCPYTFSVQARYPQGLSGKLTAKATPKSTRIPVSKLKVMAGDKRIFVTWEAPETSLSYTYKLTAKAEGGQELTLTPEANATSYLIDNLENGKEYTVGLTCIYGHGVSPTLSAKATPGEVSAISASTETPRLFEMVEFEYNPAYFVMGEIVATQWSFGDGAGSVETVARHCFAATGTYTVTLDVTYASGQKESATQKITVAGYGWSAVQNTGYQKSSAVVFSPDGQTFYTASQTEKRVIALSAITGEKQWEYATVGATYGAGPVVGADGTVYVGTEDADGTLYALAPDGKLRWKQTLGKAVKAAPAVTDDGMVYALSDAGVLYAFSHDKGTKQWSQTLEGSAAAVAVNADGTVYAATSAGVWAFTADGNSVWKADEALKVTERGGSIAIAGSRLYVTLKGKAGLAAINASNGHVMWKYATTEGDCYHPVAKADGTVYFCEKNGYLYALKADGSELFVDKTDKNYIYSGFAIAADRQVYITQYAAPFNIVSFDAAGNRQVAGTVGAQTMSPVTIGPDQRLYYSTNGSIGTFTIGQYAAKTGWPMKGGNARGSNSLK